MTARERFRQDVRRPDIAVMMMVRCLEAQAPVMTLTSANAVTMNNARTPRQSSAHRGD